MILILARLSMLMRAKTIEEIRHLCDGFYPKHSCKSSTGTITEYFFNRNPTSFNSILDIYRLNKLHCIKTACALTYYSDLEYWGFNELFLDPCCALDYYLQKDSCQKEQEGAKLEKTEAEQRLIDEYFGESCIAQTRSTLWNLTEYPETSLGARV